MVTRDRPNALSLAMQMYSELGVDLVVVDGSDVAMKSEYKPQAVTYIHAPISLVERLRLMTELPKRKWSIMVPDDEFLSLTTVKSCVSFLENSTDYVTCGGLAVDVSRFDDIGTYAALQYEQWEYDLKHEMRGVRVREKLRNYTPASYYAVSSSNDWNFMMELATRKEYGFYASFEVIFETVSALVGKSRILDELLWLRSRWNPPIRNTDISMISEMKFHRFVRQYPEVIEEISRSLALAVQSRLQEPAVEIHSWLSSGFELHTAYSRNQELGIFQRWAANLFQGRLGRLIHGRWHRRRARRSVVQSSLRQVLVRLETRGVKIPWSDVGFYEEKILAAGSGGV